MPAARDDPQAGQDDRSPLARLRALHDDGRLAGDYPRALKLLRRITPADRATAGHLLALLDPDDLLARHPRLDGIDIAVTGHSTLGGLLAPLTAELARVGLVARLRLADFGTCLTELLDTGSHLYRPGTDLVVCVLAAEGVLAELPAPWTADDAEAVLATALERLRRIVGSYAHHGTGTLVLNTVPLPRQWSHQLLDLRSRTRLSIAWREFNTGLLRLGESGESGGSGGNGGSGGSTVVLDLDVLVAAGGPLADPRLSTYTQAHLGDGTLAAYAAELADLAGALSGRTKKVLVVDADHTLWDGTLADDGAEGIAAAGTHRGEAFAAFQSALRQITAQGVLLALCTRNEPGPVREVLRTHPDMRLRDGDFVDVTANWQPKEDNLRALAQRLGLSTDSLVFVDDDPVVCARVEASAPEVVVVRLDDEPALHLERLLTDSWFLTCELTDEDRRRAARYREADVRQQAEAAADSLREYLADLGITVRLAVPQAAELARVAQLTQRTNQFNLSAERLDTRAVAALATDPHALVLAVHASDRFGDYGLVGAVLGTRRPDGLHLDNFLLSCRVFARGIEHAAVSTLLLAAREAGLPAVLGRYRPTAKNGRHEGFYRDSGFHPVPEEASVRAEEASAGAGQCTAAGSAQAVRPGLREEFLFRHDLTRITPVPEHVSVEADVPLPESPSPRPEA